MNADQLQRQVAELTWALRATEQQLLDMRALARRNVATLERLDWLRAIAEAAAVLALTPEFPDTPAGRALLAALDGAA